MGIPELEGGGVIGILELGAAEDGLGGDAERVWTIAFAWLYAWSLMSTAFGDNLGPRDASIAESCKSAGWDKEKTSRTLYNGDQMIKKLKKMCA